ncbi:MAG TPA: hypothetical protein VGZ32_22205 [Actinocrinis sp.]|jgi:hypothetical protein|uniref:hypothetical protein n=1 Tax=Actinocrinis sp. TaxID=1920516 RepID=UPI002DDDB0EA|nr:hypothetical protein [Actinocrinis sp.]HEV3173076.1 hypothetical protein [Actinocrinis sp.]
MTTETEYTPAAEPENNWTGYKEPVSEAPQDPPETPEAQETRDELTGPEPGQPEAEVPAAEAEHDSLAEPENAEDGLTEPESAQEPVAVPVGIHAGGDPLLSPEAESDLLNRWTEIQVSFVEDPRASVQDADALVLQIANTLLASFQERRSELAAAWQDGQPDTEQLRLALRQYRSFMGVVLAR